MKKFFLSQLYANLWKFTFLGSLTVGFLTAIGSFIVMRDPFSMIFGFYGLIIGFISAVIGFWCVYVLSKKNTKYSVSQISLFIGVSLATIVLAILVNNDTSFASGTLLLSIVPFFGSVYAFYWLSKKLIEPVLFEF